MRIAGIMSGTSLDGVDVAVVDITGSGARRRVVPVATGSVPYSGPLRAAILAASNAETHTSRIARLNTFLAETYAAAVRRVCLEHQVPLESLQLAACHGQTVFHDGHGRRFLGRRTPATLQLGDGSILAERLEIPVISDFRSRDMAAGGRGAPLVPYLDYFLYADPRLARAALNIGGIANVTAIPPRASPGDVIAFDTGPGNMVIDALANRFSKGYARCDRDGRRAARGHPDAAVLRLLLRNPFFRRPPPKTAGREEFGREYVDRLLATRLAADDLMATATALTAASVALGLKTHVPFPIEELVASGGGVRNPVLMAQLAAFLPGVRIRTSEEFGVDPDTKEAIAFAVLAYESWHRRPSNLPAATGARRPVILGKLSPCPATARPRRS